MAYAVPRALTAPVCGSVMVQLSSEIPNPAWLPAVGGGQASPGVGCRREARPAACLRDDIWPKRGCRPPKDGFLLSTRTRRSERLAEKSARVSIQWLTEHTLLT